MKSKFILLFLLSLMAACSDINYDGETRLVLEGKLVDEQGVPMPNRYVDVAVYSNQRFGSYASDVISDGTTNSNGDFRLIIPAPRNFENYMSIRINPDDKNYQYKEFALIQRKNFTNFRFNAQTITLYPKESLSTLTVTLQQQNFDNELTALNVDGLTSNTTIFVNPLVVDYEPFERYFDVLKNQNVTLHYTITDYSNPGNPESTDYEVVIAIGNQPQTNYILTY